MDMMMYYLLLAPVAALAVAVWVLDKKVQTLEARLNALTKDIYLGPDHGHDDLH